MNSLTRLRHSITHSRPFMAFVTRTAVGNFLLARLGRWWRRRRRDVLICPDNAFIPRVPDAGRVVDGCQVMHNGLRVRRGGYYGQPVTLMLRENRGVHEPQEERVFAEVLRHVRPGSTMLELGAYWAFYSMWFNKEVAGGTCYMVEPAADNLERGRQNFALNGMEGTFVRAYAGGRNRVAADGVPVVGVDDFLAERGIERLAILHADIQGFEHDMLLGAAKSLAGRRIDYVFISTHGNDLHRDCLATLAGHGYAVIAECDLDDTYSEDGLIAARSPEVSEPGAIEISKKRSVIAAGAAST